tara:strand:- start:14 stop:1414 length:1401 start_codon:yes stop_codon:yes gene_type:complete
MAKLGISTGAAPDDGTGSSLLVGAARVNSNFDELYTLLGAGSTTNLAPGIVTSIVAGDNISVSGGSGQVTITGSAGTSHVNTGSLNVSGISTLGVTSITDDVVVYTGKKISLTDENTIHFINGAGNGDVIRWGSAADNLRIGFGWGSYGSAAAIYSDYTVNLSSGDGRVNITSSGADSGDMVYLNSSNGVDIRTNATVTGILTASNVSTAGSVTAATFYGNGAGLTGVGGGSTAFVNAATLNVSGVSTFAGVSTFSSPVTLTDNTALNIGAAPQNLRITHTGAGNKIQTYQGGVIEIGGSADDGSNYEYGFRYTLDNQVELTFNGTKKFETTNQGTLTTGISSATGGFSGHGNDLVTSQWAVANSGSSHFTFTGPGNLSAAEDPTLYLARGQTYEFVLNASGHPFRIQTTSGAYDAGTQYETGVTNPRAAVGTIKFQIPFDAPNTLYYVCENHSAMAGTLTIYPSI